jgi:hypothetical protein
MAKALEELFDEGHRKVVCVTDDGYRWWTVGKVYQFNSDGFITDDEGDECNDTSATFEPYSFFGMRNKEFTPEDLDALATAVAEKVCAIIVEKLK